jgi:hypothetical protein
MGHKFSSFWESLTRNMAKGEQESQGEGQGTKSTQQVFPDPVAPSGVKPAPFYQTQKSAGISPFDTSVTRYSQEGALAPPHF